MRKLVNSFSSLLVVDRVKSSLGVPRDPRAVEQKCACLADR